MLPWAVWYHWPYLMGKEAGAQRAYRWSRPHRQGLAYFKYACWSPKPLSFFCVPLPFTNSQYGLGPVPAPLCLSFLFCEVRENLSTWTDTQSQKAMLALSSRILPPPDPCFWRHMNSAPRRLPCCPVAPAEVAIPVEGNILLGWRLKAGEVP